MLDFYNRFMIACRTNCVDCNYCYTNTTAISVSICISIIMTVEFVIGIVAAIYTGRGCCGNSYSSSKLRYIFLK